MTNKIKLLRITTRLLAGLCKPDIESRAWTRWNGKTDHLDANEVIEVELKSQPQEPPMWGIWWESDPKDASHRQERREANIDHWIGPEKSTAIFAYLSRAAVMGQYRKLQHDEVITDGREGKYQIRQFGPDGLPLPVPDYRDAVKDAWRDGIAPGVKVEL